MLKKWTVAAAGDEARVSALVRETIEAVYPRYYPRAVVDFFLVHHGIEKIAADVARGDVRLLTARGELIGTGSACGNEIRRVFVAPAMQEKGYGTRIMDTLEGEIAAEYDEAVLDASLPACGIYERRGYECVRHVSLPVEDGAVLVYARMKKALVRIEMAEPGDTRFQALVRALDEHLAQALGRGLQREFYDQYNATSELLVVALAMEGGEAVGCGGIKAHGDDAELKRMFVRPDRRGRRLGARIVGALEAEARARGFKRMILETGKALVSAQKLYLRLGFHVIENYGQYKGLANSVCMEKEL